MTTLTPFADDTASVSIGTLTLENGTDRIALYGSLDLTRDLQGLEHARTLKAILDQAVRVLEAQKDLPGAVPAALLPGRVANPFD